MISSEQNPPDSENLQALHFGPRLEESAPLFTARTTMGIQSLEDYRGQWVILFSHPADFTPVCTSEFVAFQKALPEFEALNCSLLGLSVDSVYSHIAWLKSIEENFDTRVTFPIIEDVSMAISSLYGMIHETSSSTATVRSVFVIDPKGILKALLHYPLALGRSVEELLRILRGLQLSERSSVDIPAGWHPGQGALHRAPCEVDSVVEEDEPWYFRKVNDEELNS